MGFVRVEKVDTDVFSRSLSSSNAIRFLLLAKLELRET